MSWQELYPVMACREPIPCPGQLRTGSTHIASFYKPLPLVLRCHASPAYDKMTLVYHENVVPCAQLCSLCPAVFPVPCCVPCALLCSLCPALFPVPCCVPCALLCSLCPAVFPVPCCVPCALPCARLCFDNLAQTKNEVT